MRKSREAVALSDEGETWDEVYATDNNALHETRVDFGRGGIQMMRVTMRESHPVYGRLAGHALYGIKSLAVFAPRLRTVFDNCAAAAKSTDARDKYFLTHVGQSDLSPLKALQSEVPALEAGIRIECI